MLNIGHCRPWRVGSIRFESIEQTNKKHSAYKRLQLIHSFEGNWVPVKGELFNFVTSTWMWPLHSSSLCPLHSSRFVFLIVPYFLNCTSLLNVTICNIQKFLSINKNKITSFSVCVFMRLLMIINILEE